jgi:hypothetical protein
MSEKKKWYQNYAVKITAIVLAISGTVTLLRYASSGFEWFKTQTELKEDVSRIDSLLTIVINGDKKFHDFVDKKNKSFAVGYRVKITTDENGEERWILQYRDKKKHLHNVILDKEASEYYGRDYYFYYDRKTHEKIYCP